MDFYNENDYIVEDAVSKTYSPTPVEDVPKDFKKTAAHLLDTIIKVTGNKAGEGQTDALAGMALSGKTGKDILDSDTRGAYSFIIPKEIRINLMLNTPRKWRELADEILQKAGFRKGQVAISENYTRYWYKHSSNDKYIFAAFYVAPTGIIPITTQLHIYLQCTPNIPDTRSFVESSTTGNKYIRNYNSTSVLNEECLEPVYSGIINEHFDVTDRETRNTLLSLDEADRSSVLLSLTNKLYDNIVDKTNDIDYGDIPASMGNITKIPNFNKLVDSVSLMRDILVQYKQPTGPIDEMFTAMHNMESRKDMFYRAYKNNIELPILAYCNLTLAIISAVSYLISTTIEFVKSPKDETFEIALDKVAYTKAKDHILYTSIKRFNKTCSNHDFDKAMETVMKTAIKQSGFVGAATVATGIGIGIAVIAILLSIIPIFRELIFFFYYTRMRASDFFDIQADLLQMNAYNIEHNNTKDSDERVAIAAKQYSVVDRFRKASNFFAINSKKAEIESDKEIKASSKKPKINDVVDEMPDSAGSVLF